MVTFALSSLNQWILDFQGNVERILQSIKDAVVKGADYRLGSDLEICGYNCQDHFFEPETFERCLEGLAYLILHAPKEIICDVGIPLYYQLKAYICRVVFSHGIIHSIVPCTKLRSDSEGNCYREGRWFCEWPSRFIVEYELPKIIKILTGQSTVIMGDMNLHLKSYGRIKYWQSSEDIIKESDCTKSDLIVLHTAPQYFIENQVTARSNEFRNQSSNSAVVLFVNFHGSDGDRMIFDGGSSCSRNGVLCKIGRRFSLREIETTIFSVELKSSNKEDTECIILTIDYLKISDSNDFLDNDDQLHDELWDASACWLWDHMRRSGASGFFLPLSGGIDSGCVACIVYHLCSMIIQDYQSIKTLECIIGTQLSCTNARDLCKDLLTTAYLSTAHNSADSKQRSEQLAKQINSHHFLCGMDNIISAVLTTFKLATGLLPRFFMAHGSSTENTALQNLQARLRMVMTYLFAQLTPISRQRSGFLLVLGTGNADENIIGYFTKYDCSSSDLNPIGGMSKNTVRKLSKGLMEKYKLTSMMDIIQAKPSAELQPESDTAQTDEQDLGLTYDLIEEMSKLRAVDHYGPRAMTSKMGKTSTHKFFSAHRRNRHKTTVATPSMFCQLSATDDCRSDFRPFTYPRCDVD